nr:uncharacterized protein LOC129164288 [Nothobranchius furzeri]
MAAVIGSVSPFDGDLQSWEEYSEMLDFFFEANEITDTDKKKAVLLSGVGPATYSLLRNLLSPEAPKDKTYVQLTQTLRLHFSPKPSEIVQRFKFNSQVRRHEESVADYVAELRKLAQHCDYGAALPQMLRNRLVCGVNDDRMQRRLLSEVDLTFDKALTLCQAMESASKDVRDLQEILGDEVTPASRVSRSQGTVHKILMDKAQLKSLSCFRCNGRHLGTECRFAAERCHGCGKRGHIKRACRSKWGPQEKQKKGPLSKKEGRRDPNRGSQTHLLRTEGGSDAEESDGINTIYNVSGGLPKVAPITRMVSINGLAVLFEIDTGCGVTILSKQYSLLCNKTAKSGLSPCSLILKTYTGEKLGVLGMAQVEVEDRNARKTLPLVVVDGAGPNLLGRSWLQELSMAEQLVNNVGLAPTETRWIH